MIHTVGDSHSMFGWKDVDQSLVKINHIGPKLMYTFSRDREKVVTRSVYSSIRAGDFLIYCFGEIDCRCHVAKHVSSDIDHIKIINQLSSDYTDAVQYMSSKYMQQGAKPAVYSIVPPIRKLEGVSNSEFPFLGSDHERLQYHRYMNERLRSLCSERDIMFFDVTRKYEDSDGYLIPEKSDRKCHISDPQGIIETLQEMGLVSPGI